MATIWDTLSGLFDGMTKVSESAEGLTGSLADNSENVARGKSAFWNELQTREERDLQMKLDQIKVLRGDNVQLYWAVAIAALLGVVLLK